MKKWTVVIEITDTGESFWSGKAGFLTQKEVEEIASKDLSVVHYRVMETIEAPYGPQYPNGVFLRGRLHSKFDETNQSKQVRR